MITTGSSDPFLSFEAFDAVTIATFDLDGDGTKEIIAQNDNNNLYVFNGRTGELLWELVTEHPREWEARTIAGPSVGDVTGNGLVDIVVTNSAGWLTVFEVQPAEDPEDKFHVEMLWEKWMDPREQEPDYLRNHPWAEFEGHPGLDGSAYLADASGDGRDEIFLQLDDMPGLFALNGDGEVIWYANWTEGNSNPVAADLTGDGVIEVMYPSDGGQIVLINGKHLHGICTIDLKEEGPFPASISVAPTVVDLTGDGAKEMVFGVRNAVEDEDDPEWYLEQNAHFFAVTADCEVLWHQTWDWANPHVHMHPVPVDLTGNGDLAVVFHDWNTVGHKPGDWQSTGEANLFAVDAQSGELIWHRETQSPWSNKNIVVADVIDDGDEEILVVENRGGNDGIMLYDMQGNRVQFIPSPEGWDVTRGPAVADLDGDGFLEIILPVHREASGCTRELDVGCREGAIVVYKTPGVGDPTWSNALVYNNKYDIEKAPLYPVSEVGVSQDTSGDGFALIIDEADNAAAVHVRVPGTFSWQRLDDQGDGLFSSDLVFAPFDGDEVMVRVFESSGRAGIAMLEAEGPSTMLQVDLRSSQALQDARVKISDGSGTVWEGQTTGDAKVRVELPPGTYTVEASAPGHRDASSEVTVEEEVLTRLSLEMRSTLVVLWWGLGGAAVALAGAVFGGVFVKRRRRDRLDG
jgi:outer membrane protein assembly factor BamB